MSAAQGLNVEERQRLVALKELEGGDLPWTREAVSGMVLGADRGGGGSLPLTILQKMQEAILLYIHRCLLLGVWEDLRWRKEVLGGGGEGWSDVCIHQGKLGGQEP
jgi:hypothetical protein